MGQPKRQNNSKNKPEDSTDLSGKQSDEDSQTDSELNTNTNATEKFSPTNNGTPLCNSVKKSKSLKSKEIQVTEGSKSIPKTKQKVNETKLKNQTSKTLPKDQSRSRSRSRGKSPRNEEVQKGKIEKSETSKHNSDEVATGEAIKRFLNFNSDASEDMEVSFRRDEEFEREFRELSSPESERVVSPIFTSEDEKPIKKRKNRRLEYSSEEDTIPSQMLRVSVGEREGISGTQRKVNRSRSPRKRKRYVKQIEDSSSSDSSSSEDSSDDEWYSTRRRHKRSRRSRSRSKSNERRRKAKRKRKAEQDVKSMVRNMLIEIKKEKKKKRRSRTRSRSSSQMREETSDESSPDDEQSPPPKRKSKSRTQSRTLPTPPKFKLPSDHTVYAPAFNNPRMGNNERGDCVKIPPNWPGF